MNSKSNSSTPIFYSDEETPNTEGKSRKGRIVNGNQQYGDSDEHTRSQRNGIIYKTSSENSSTGGDF